MIMRFKREVAFVEEKISKQLNKILFLKSKAHVTITIILCLKLKSLSLNSYFLGLIKIRILYLNLRFYILTKNFVLILKMLC